MEGITIIPDDDDILNVRAWIRGPDGTPFEGGYFQVRILFGTDYPTSPPKGVFLTKIFHPNVSETGDICVNTLKKDWKSDLGIKHILLTIKCLLIYPNPESALNEEAGKLLLEDYDTFSKRVRVYTRIHAPKTIDVGSGSDDVENGVGDCEKVGADGLVSRKRPAGGTEVVLNGSTKPVSTSTQGRSGGSDKRRTLRRL